MDCGTDLVDGVCPNAAAYGCKPVPARPLAPAHRIGSHPGPCTGKCVAFFGEWEVT